MKKWALDPVAWISAVLLFGLLTALGIAFAALSPWLGELFRMSPRLAMLAMLGFWVSPVAIVAIGHHAVHRVMDGVDRQKVAKGPLPSVMSLWAGFFGWFVMAFATTTTWIVMLVLVPPPPPEEGGLWASAATVLAHPQDGGNGVLSAHSLVWILIAGSLCAFERLVKARVRVGEG